MKKKSERERIRETKQLRKRLSDLYKVGDLVCFRPNPVSKRFQEGIIVEKNAPHFEIQHPSGESWSVWVEQISHKLSKIKFRGLCEYMVDNRVHPSRIEQWIKVLESFKPVSNPNEVKAIDTLLSALNWAKPQCEEEEPVYTESQVLFESVPVEETEEFNHLLDVASASRERGYFEYHYNCAECNDTFIFQTEVDIDCPDCESELHFIEKVATK